MAAPAVLVCGWRWGRALPPERKQAFSEAVGRLFVAAMPKPLALLNRMFLWIAFRDRTVEGVRRNAVVSVRPVPALETSALPDS